MQPICIGIFKIVMGGAKKNTYSKSRCDRILLFVFFSIDLIYQPVEFVIQKSDPGCAFIQSPGLSVKLFSLPLQLLLITTE
jgi:hypothetical protein